MRRQQPAQRERHHQPRPGARERGVSARSCGAQRAQKHERKTRRCTRLHAATLRLRRAAPQAQRHPSRPRVHPARTRSGARLKLPSQAGRASRSRPSRPVAPARVAARSGRAMIFTGGGTFYLSDAALLDSPSRGDGVSAEAEFKLRVYGAELVQAGAILLRLCVALRVQSRA